MRAKTSTILLLLISFTFSIMSCDKDEDIDPNPSSDTPAVTDNSTSNEAMLVGIWVNEEHYVNDDIANTYKTVSDATHHWTFGSDLSFEETYSSIDYNYTFADVLVSGPNDYSHTRTGTWELITDTKFMLSIQGPEIFVIESINSTTLVVEDKNEVSYIFTKQ